MPIEGLQNIPTAHEFIHIPSNFIASTKGLPSSYRLSHVLSENPEIMAAALRNPSLLIAINSNPSLLSALKSNPYLLEAIETNPRLLSLIQSKPGFLESLRTSLEPLTNPEKTFSPTSTTERKNPSLPLSTKSNESKTKPELTTPIPRRAVSRTSFLSERPLAKSVMNMLVNTPETKQSTTINSNQNSLPGLKLPLALIADSRLLGPALLSLLGSIAVTTNKTTLTGASKEVGIGLETESERQQNALEEPEQVAGVGEISEANSASSTVVR